MDKYIPRKCSWTNKIIQPKDFGSIQVNVAEIDSETGTYTGKFFPVALSGAVRKRVSTIYKYFIIYLFKHFRYTFC